MKSKLKDNGETKLNTIHTTISQNNDIISKGLFMPAYNIIKRKFCLLWKRADKSKL